MFDQIIGRSPPMKAIKQTLKRLVKSDITLLLIGETGTGKRLIAQSIHRASHRQHGPFTVLGCASLNPLAIELEAGEVVLESALKHLFRELLNPMIDADGGTLLLEHVEMLPLALQPMLLRVLEWGEVQTPHATAPVKIDVRVLATSNGRLAEQVRAGRFRPDLYYRLSGFPIELPPLRRRRMDILPLFEYFMKRFGEKHGLNPGTPGAAAITELTAYPWPENVRELRQVAERLALLNKGTEIGVDDLPKELRSSPGYPDTTVELPEDGLNLTEFEMDMIRQALIHSRGRLAQAARLLNISRHTLNYRMEKHGLDRVPRDTAIQAEFFAPETSIPAMAGSILQGQPKNAGRLNVKSFSGRGRLNR